MANKLLVLMAHDARLQFRYGIYYAYGFVVGFYILVLVYGSAYLPNWVPGLVIFTDPSVVGFFFLGALMMLEKGEDTRSALGITPISSVHYFWSKALTLSALSLASVGILGWFLHDSVNWLILLPVVMLTAIHFIGIGVPTTFWFKTVTGYLIGAAGWLMPVILPGGLAFLDPMPSWAIVIPAASQFKLVLIATGRGSAAPLEIAAMFVVAVLAAWLGVWLALRSLRKEFGGK